MTDKHRFHRRRMSGFAFCGHLIVEPCQLFGSFDCICRLRWRCSRQYRLYCPYHKNSEIDNLYEFFVKCWWHTFVDTKITTHRCSGARIIWPKHVDMPAKTLTTSRRCPIKRGPYACLDPFHSVVIVMYRCFLWTTQCSCFAVLGR